MTEHLDRCLEEMARRHVDVLMLGREANARYVSGARRLWLAGTRAFAPGCAVVRSTGSVHLLSITDEGIPPEIPPERLYPISWNPMNIVGAVTGAPGAADARRIGVDGLTPLFEQLLSTALPTAELVDGEDLMRAVRRVKSPGDVEAIRGAIAIAEDALGAAIGALRPGVRERELLGVFAERMASHGVTTPAFEGVFAVSVEAANRRRFSSDRVIEAGDLVTMSAGALADGWEGTLARTWPCGESDPERERAWSRWWGTWTTLVDRCRPGARVGDLRATGGAAVDGVGMGHEIVADVDVLEEGMVVALELWHAGVLGQETLLVTQGGHQPLTLHPHAATAGSPL
jgi:Xaa-Pro dipeptidase